MDMILRQVPLININMRCIEIKNIKGLHNGYSGLTLTWDVLK